MGASYSRTAEQAEVLARLVVQSRKHADVPMGTIRSADFNRELVLAIVRKIPGYEALPAKTCLVSFLFRYVSTMLMGSEHACTSLASLRAPMIARGVSSGDTEHVVGFLMCADWMTVTKT